ncbi:anaerobic ribonucleoside-triphosphate reductase activating protein [Bdellovibrio reynosensis]|uniref:Anaerobic ribonucleoside-triphosphate reductase activating protein n=1 Tax=Bdellovibrio reynosensis TaxID=2835041 RepID=A0ABY4CCY5_9BACT|nr:anaerobic ribonucleoside-triphosphate reductase activating protein [Bdellovibrio reynosensis]UOF01531.1 anaerobic ribonucleoside-triphosphate reductase activating protein [Bdellovibrio reynosensis]
MNIYKYDILFQEVPNHISLGFYVCGCSLRCPGCHSPELWPENNGYALSEDLFESLLDRYSQKITCVVFLGGEWHPQKLVQLLSKASARGLKTALYTGLNDVSPELKSHLDFLKCGPWVARLGGLSSQTTNQIFWDVKNALKLNHLFQQQEIIKETP